MKRELVARALVRSGAVDAVLAARRRLRIPGLITLTYHRVLERVAGDELDPATTDARPGQLASQLDLLARHFHFVSTADLAAALHGRRLPPSPLLLSFDDGYRDNHDIVLPLLRARGIAATFFIATGYPEAGRLYWWDKVHLLVSRSRRPELSLGGPLPMTLRLADRRAAARRLLSAIKRAQGLDLHELFAALVRATGVRLDEDEERAIAARTIMSWDEIRALAAAGMDVQSHSHHHRVLATMGDRELLDDLAASRRALGGRLGRVPRAIAYPVGRPLGTRERSLVARAGFELGFTNATGGGLGWRDDPLGVPRLAMDRDTDPDLFRAQLAFPGLAHGLPRGPAPTFDASIDPLADAMPAPAADDRGAT